MPCAPILTPKRTIKLISATERTISLSFVDWQRLLSLKTLVVINVQDRSMFGCDLPGMIFEGAPSRVDTQASRTLELGGHLFDYTN
jgi:hypothetical protein